MYRASRKYKTRNRFLEPIGRTCDPQKISLFLDKSEISQVFGEHVICLRFSKPIGYALKIHNYSLPRVPANLVAWPEHRQTFLCTCKDEVNTYDQITANSKTLIRNVLRACFNHEFAIVPAGLQFRAIPLGAS